jgi:murein DD-endopeptidase MepM/ murein hydrolase activator NlpD
MINGGLAASARDLDSAYRRVAAAERVRARTEARLARTQAQLHEHEGRLRLRAVHAYIGGSMSLGGDDSALQVETVDDLGKTLAYGAAVVEDERLIVRRMAALRDEADALHHDADQAAHNADEGRNLVQLQQQALESERDRIVGTQSELAKNAAAKLSLLSEAAQRQAEIEAGYARKQAVHDSISNVLGSRQADQLPPIDRHGIYLSPLPHPRISQPFGSGYDPLLGVTRGHPGMDMPAPTGTPIRAPADGEVVAAGWVEGYGNCTIIDHGSALGTLYGHQSLIAVQPGDKVRRGQVIGFVGSTGYSTGPHLHWEVRLHGNVVDPAPFIGSQD